MSETKIEWTERVWNPVTGCTKISVGCKNCFASRMAKRLAGRYGYPAAPHQFDVTLHPERLDLPMKWKKPSMIFVDSMSDLFHEKIDDKFIFEVFTIMWISPLHIFQILTKRPQRMCELLNFWLKRREEIEKSSWFIPSPNVWLGVSVENQETADERIPWLLKTPAAVKFVSAEPLLGPINLRHSINRNNFGPYEWDLTHRINWVICGCESGPGARPMDIEWARSLRNQCLGVDTPFFLKQMVIDGKLVKMPELDGKQWHDFPEMR